MILPTGFSEYDKWMITPTEDYTKRYTARENLYIRIGYQIGYYGIDYFYPLFGLNIEHYSWYFNWAKGVAERRRESLISERTRKR